MRRTAVALCVFLACARATFISTGEEDMCKEDARLVAELRRRANHDDAIRAFRPLKVPPDMFQVRHPAAFRKEMNEQRRNKTSATTSRAYNKANPQANNKVNIRRNNRYNNRTNNQAKKYKSTSPLPKDFRRWKYGTSRHYWFPTDPPDRALRHKMIDMVEQAIYGAQYRLKDLEPIARKYTDLLEYRIAYIFKRLELIEHEMELVYSYLSQMINTEQEAIFRIMMYLIYYEEVLGQHVDVTYICERLTYLHGTQEGKRMKDRAAHKQEHRVTSAGGTERHTGALSMDDIVRIEKDKARKDRLRQEEGRDRQVVTRKRDAN